MTKFGEDLIQSAKEAVSIAKGESEPARFVLCEDVDVAAIRKRLGLSQDRFAAQFNLSPATVRDWEQRRRQPDRIARTLLAVIDLNPDAAKQAADRVRQSH